ncbi:MAG: hypothetical protein EBZ53_08020 [Verrucomicrobia bacterium]|nr:hypothetical protein [Verrucomicrobiota bacterium]
MKPRYDFNKGKLISYDGEIIEFAETKIIDKYADQVQEIMSLFNLKKGEYILTDESTIGHFGKETINKILLEKFKKKYGFSLTNKSNISKIAEMMYNHRPF